MLSIEPRDRLDLCLQMTFAAWRSSSRSFAAFRFTYATFVYICDFITVVWRLMKVISPNETNVKNLDVS